MATNDFVVKNGLDVTEAAIVRATTDSSTKDNGALIVEGGAGIEKNLNVGVNLSVGGTAAITGNTTLTGDIAVNGGDITTNQTTFNLVETTATTLNVGGAATTLNVGASSGTTNVRNNLNVVGDVDIDGGDLTASTTTFNLINTTATTLNIGGAATAVSLGAATGALTVNNARTVFNSTNSIQLPVGNSSQRSGTPTQGQIRYNSELSLYEGYGAGNQWNSLGGVRDVDGDTYILAELTPAANNNTLFFYAGGVNSLSLTASLLDVKVGTTLSVANATEASSSITGAVQIAGGVGIAKRLYVGGGIQNTAIGSSVANTGAFTSLTANGAVTFTQNTASTSTSTGTLVVSGGVGITGGINTGLSSTFNGLSSTNTTALSPANAPVTISPTGTGTVTINPSALGTINNMSIGADQAQSGRFTALVVTSTFNAGGSNGTSGQVLVSTGSGIQWATSSSIQNGSGNVSVASNGVVTVTASGTLITTFTSTNVNIPVSTPSTSIGTGALTVAGGVSIGGQLTLGGNLITSGLAAFGTTSIDPDDYTAYTGGFGNIADGSGWGARGLFVHGGGAGDAAAIGHNGAGLYFGIQNGTAANTMTGWLEVTPARAISFVNGTGFTYNANTIWHSGNDGSGSGLDADTLDGFGTSQAAAGTTIPVRDSNGYLYGNYINMSDNSQTSGVTAIICKAGDNFYRSASAAATATFISGQTMNIAGNAATVTNGVYTEGAQTINGVKTFSSPIVISGSTGSITFANSGTTKRGVTGTMGDNDQWFIGGGATSTNQGFLEISTGDDGGQEPIFVRQYNGAPEGGTVARSASLLDASGNTSFPGTLSAPTVNVSGTLTAATINETSSIAYKENVIPIDSALNKVLQLVGVTYDRKDGSRKNEAGLIAEEVAKIIPNIVSEKEGKPEGIQYTKLTAYLIECIKELNAKIERLEGKQ
jgi:hypothetical protein